MVVSTLEATSFVQIIEGVISTSSCTSVVTVRTRHCLGIKLLVQCCIIVQCMSVSSVSVVIDKLGVVL